jgi:hypothetical protein
MLVSFINYIVLRQDASFVRVDSPLQLYCNRNMFPFMFQTVVLGSLKPFCQMDHQIDISRCLTKASALCYSEKSVFLTPTCCTSSTTSLLAS